MKIPFARYGNANARKAYSMRQFSSVKWCIWGGAHTHAMTMEWLASIPIPSSFPNYIAFNLILWFNSVRGRCERCQDTSSQAAPSHQPNRSEIQRKFDDIYSNSISFTSLSALRLCVMTGECERQICLHWVFECDTFEWPNTRNNNSIKSRGKKRLTANWLHVRMSCVIAYRPITRMRDTSLSSQVLMYVYKIGRIHRTAIDDGRAKYEYINLSKIHLAVVQQRCLN